MSPSMHLLWVMWVEGHFLCFGTVNTHSGGSHRLFPKEEVHPSVTCPKVDDTESSGN